MKNYKELRVWQQGLRIVGFAYEVARQLPREETYGLRSQMTRTAISIPSNIAEGSSRTSELEYKHFLEIALGSCFELDTQLIAAIQLGFIELPPDHPLPTLLEEEIKMLHGFISRLSSTSKAISQQLAANS
ncbi:MULTISPECIES: four helix bundle protein [Hymenobacter]|uniref:Four helix bundle protein n=1 Tax=Hymenobacter profundi TaxID=1982110 RepID=A0ABS6WXG0_9BACT|nr:MULTISPECIES: four helix bundle protein [Hymenobacter]MBW3127937.1 four helix bundle protein [Hymenobacter profundi]QNE41576.1 four helix bundle protein [Hymenobacter sp. NBH84]